MNPFSVAKRILAITLLFSFVSAQAFADEVFESKKGTPVDASKLTPDMSKAYKTFLNRTSLGVASSPGTPGMGMYGSFALGPYGLYEDAQRPITPLVSKGDDPLKPLREKIEAAQRELLAREDNVDMLGFDLKDRRSTLKDITAQISAAKKEGKPTAELESKLAKETTELEEFRQAYGEARMAKVDSLKELGVLQKKLDAEEGKSQGWTLSDSPEDRALAAKEGFKCGDGERMTSKPGFGVYNWACLNSKGLLTHEASRNIGMLGFDMDLNYERDGDKLTKIVTKSRDGKLLSEQSYGKNEQTLKMYNGEALTSSCTTYGDPRALPSGGIFGPSVSGTRQ